MPAAPARVRLFLHPLHAIFLAFPIALFTGALVSDITYLNSAEMQWSNFSAWLITGALLFGGLVVAWAIVAAFLNRRTNNARPAAFYLGAVALMWIIGLVNAFQHSKDAWSSVGAIGLVLSILSTLLALVAGWIGYSSYAHREIVR